MEFKVFTSIAVFLAVAASSSFSTASLDATFRNSLESFEQKLFHELTKSHGHNNIIYSPFSIQNCLTMARMGAEGDTAIEMDQALGLTDLSLKSTADNYNSLLARYENNSILQLASKIFVTHRYELNDDYNNLLTHQFYSSADSVDFGKGTEAAANINNWVELKTQNSIKELVTANDIDGDTVVMLLSVIHFKGNWKQPFVESNTNEREFFIDETQSIKVPMMHKTARIEYSAYPELGAKGVRLPYKDSDLSMLIFLPNDRTGLAAMEEKLRAKQLVDFTQRMSNTLTEVYLPKFKVEFKVELSDILQKLGMKSMFAHANFNKMLKSAGNLKVSTVLHKAVIEVNERGTEAAAATAMETVSYTLPRFFNAEHPFHYMIVNADHIVLFEGNIVKF